MMPEPRRI